MNHNQKQIQTVIDSVKNNPVSEISNTSNMIRLKVRSFYEDTKFINITLEQLENLSQEN